MERGQYSEQQQEFIARQLRCLETEGRILQDIGVYAYLNDRLEEHRKRDEECWLKLFLRSAVADVVKDRLQQDPFLKRAVIVPNYRGGPQVTLALRYNPREVVDIKTLEREVVGVDSLEVAALPDNAFRISKAHLRKGLPPLYYQKIELPQSKWQDKEVLMDVLNAAYVIGPKTA